MKRARIVLILALSIVVGGRIPAAMACSCAAGSPKQYFEWATHVFVGVVVGVETGSSDDGVRSSADPVKWTFDVEEVQKGTVGSPEVVRTTSDEASCGYSFTQGNRYRVFVYEDEGGRHHTGLCSGNEDLGPAGRTGGGSDPGPSGVPNEKPLEDPGEEPAGPPPDEPKRLEREPQDGDDGPTLNAEQLGAPEVAVDTADGGRGAAIALGLLGLLGAGSATAITLARRRARA